MVFPHSGAPSSSKQTAASRVPTLSGSWGNSLWKTVTGPGVGWQSWWHQGNRCKFGQRICCFNYFQFTVKREWRSISKRCAFVEKQKILERKVKLRQKLRREIGRREFLTSHFQRPCKSLNLNDFSYIKQVDGQIRLREIKISLYE